MARFFGPLRLKIRTAQLEHSCYTMRFLHLNIRSRYGCQKRRSCSNPKLLQALCSRIVQQTFNLRGKPVVAAQNFCAAAATNSSLCGALRRICCILWRIYAAIPPLPPVLRGKMIPVAHFFRAAATATSARRQKTPVVCNALKLLHTCADYALRRMIR